MGARRRDGYGVINVHPRYEAAHRVSYKLNVGPIPEGYDVCHRCDNRQCVRPDHLFTGTRSDNMADAASKGRLVHQCKPWLTPRGSKHGRTELTEGEVAEARRRVRDGESYTSVARWLGVCRTAATNAVKGVMWRHVSEPAAESHYS